MCWTSGRILEMRKAKQRRVQGLDRKFGSKTEEGDSVVKKTGEGP